MPIELRLKKAKAITLSAPDLSGLRNASATGSDPHFLASWRGGEPLAAGWYEFGVRLRRSDRLVQPILYPDYGEGFEEATRIPLVLRVEAEDWHTSIVWFEADVKELRFDPTTRPTEFAVGACRLRRIGRARAIAAMTRQLVGDRDATARRLLFAEAFEQFRADGRSAVDTFLRGRYLASRRSEYAAWFATYGGLDGPGPGELDALAVRPVFSIVVPVYNTPGRWLNRCIDSVLAQSYPHWELCLADDASTVPGVRRTIERYLARDPRIRAVFRAENGHISAATNSALELATGDHVALLDHDDELHPHALYEVAKALAANPAWRIVYTDQDKLDETGHHLDPYFKPDWNPDLLRSQNYVNHLAVFDRQLVADVGGLRVGVEGAQDWDLVLRCSERLTAREIGHVPRVLYHWRSIPGSTAAEADHKDYAAVAARRALSEHLARTGSRGEALPSANGQGDFRVRYEVPHPAPAVSVLFGSRDGNAVQRVARAVPAATAYPSWELVIATDDETAASLPELGERVRIVTGELTGRDGLRALAARHATGEVLVFVGDVEPLAPSWLDELVSHATRPQVGVVGAMVYRPDGRISHAGLLLGLNGAVSSPYSGRPRGWYGQKRRATLIQNLSAVGSGCLALRREVFDAAGGFDPDLDGMRGDADLCLRSAGLGYRTLWTPYAELRRGTVPAPRDEDEVRRQEDVLRGRWESWIANDPAGNPNLDTVGRFPLLAFPPRYSRP